MTEKKEEKDPLSNIIPDPDKVLEDLKINASYVSSLQQILVYVLSTAESADTITNAYKKINLLDKVIKEDKLYEGEPFNSFDSTLYTLISLTAYLRQEVINQKAYKQFSGEIDKEQFGPDLRAVLEAKPEDLDEEMGKLTQKMAEALGEVKATED
tara:strand:- start:13969 stop:14433 length:465 start_codon:yes stop_codon:yes gene_type:complete